MIKACIFDLDGVLVDTAKFHFQAWNRMAQKLGFSITLQQNELLKGVSRKESLDIILSIGKVVKSEDEKLELMEEKNLIYLELISGMDSNDMLPGAENLLWDLKQNGIPIALGSASKNAVTILNSMGIIDLFQVIIDGTKTTNSKPHPQVFNMGASALGVLPEKCIVFEDSISGIQAANTGGFYSIGIGSAESLSEAQHILPDLQGITFEQLKEITNSSECKAL